MATTRCFGFMREHCSSILQWMHDLPPIPILRRETSQTQQSDVMSAATAPAAQGRLHGSSSSSSSSGIDTALHKELLLVCTALGSIEAVEERAQDGSTVVVEKFIRGENCLEWLQDLQRCVCRSS